MGMYDIFETDSDLETKGVIVDYGDFRVRIAAAGPANKEHVKYIEKKLKPIRKALDAGAISAERSQAIMADVYAQTIVMSWEVLKDDKWVPGIEGKDGKILPFTKENVEAALRSLPRLLNDLMEQAQSLQNFRKAELEEEAKNS